MDWRKLLPALLLGTALAMTATAVIAKDHGGATAAQHESVGKDGETGGAGPAGRGDTETADDKGGSETGEAGGDHGGRDTDHIQFEDQGDHEGGDGVPHLEP